jgi:hypothetical protein
LRGHGKKLLLRSPLSGWTRSGNALTDDGQLLRETLLGNGSNAARTAIGFSDQREGLRMGGILMTRRQQQTGWLLIARSQIQYANDFVTVAGLIFQWTPPPAITRCGR